MRGLCMFRYAFLRNFLSKNLFETVPRTHLFSQGQESRGLGGVGLGGSGVAEGGASSDCEWRVFSVFFAGLRVTGNLS